MSAMASGVLLHNDTIVLHRVALACNFISRLRGWAGLDPEQYNAILLTPGAAVHALWGPAPLELLWLNHQQYCIQQQTLLPGKIAWFKGAQSVLEALPGRLNNQQGRQLLWKPY